MEAAGWAGAGVGVLGCPVAGAGVAACSAVGAGVTGPVDKGVGGVSDAETFTSACEDWTGCSVGATTDGVTAWLVSADPGTDMAADSEVHSGVFLKSDI